MAEIIDLDFYRRFRVALPIRQENFFGEKPYKSAQPKSSYFKKRRPSLYNRRHKSQNVQEKDSG